MSTCRSCRAPVVWVESEARADKPGRKMPLDADPTNIKKALRVIESESEPGRGVDGGPLGNLLFTGQRAGDGTWIVRYVKAGKNMFRAHWATCPDARSHRKPTTKGR